MIENLAASLRLLLVTDDSLVADRDLVDLCRRAVAGGVTAVQLRLKLRDDIALVAVARQLRASLDVPLFVNDRIDVALACGADGVHLGADDIAPVLARRIAPPGFVIGASVGSDDEAVRGAPADYWGIGPLHRTTTKPGAGEPLGWDGSRALLRLAGKRPCVVIGGVVEADGAVARSEGFSGVAVSGGILGGDDPEGAARRYARN